MAIIRLQPEERLLFACLKQDMSETEASALASAFKDELIVWDAVLSISFVQGVAPLLYVNLEKCSRQGLPVPAKTLNDLALCYRNSEESHAHRQEKLNDVLQFAAGLEKDVMLLKGAAYNAIVFKDPAVTISGDVDVLFKNGTDCFTYEQLQYLYDFNRYESFEIDFQDHHDLDINNTLPIDYQEIWKDARSIDLHGAPCFVMGPEDMLVFACVNSGRKRFFHLKALFNIAEIIRTHPQMDWQVVAAKARRYRCERIVLAALLCVSGATGVAVPENLAKVLRVGFLGNKLIRYLVRNMSFSDLADRTLFLDGGTAVTGLADKNKRNRSLFLVLAVYDIGQIFRRLRILCTPKKIY